MLTTSRGRSAFLALLLACSPALAADNNSERGPNRVLVVVNLNSEVSQQIAGYYIERRGIPPQNRCEISAPAQETVSREAYEGKIENAIGDCLARGDARERIDYIVTTKGVPLRTSGSEGRDGVHAAVDSELTLLYQKLAGQDHELRGRLPNPFFRHHADHFDKAKFPIYLVARLTGYTLDDVRRAIDRSLEARNRGRFVIDESPVKNDMGNEWLRSASRILPSDRVLVEKTNDVAYNVADVIGYASWGSNDPQRLVDGKRFLGFGWLPGAIATEFVSSDGRTFEEPPADWRPAPWASKQFYFAGTPQSLTAEFLREGATGASGHVYEPYLDAVPQPQYVFPAYARGRNLIESFYLGIPFLSWMNVVVGDPLCRLQ